MSKISVLMGAYNCADTIGRSIESIQAQTFADWELIICDDGSEDHTIDVIKKYAEQDTRIQLIQNEHNKGLSYTLNHCLQYANSEYCARMDGDDICDPIRLEKEYEFLVTHPEYSIISTTMKRFDENGVYSIPEIGQIYEVNKNHFIKGSPFCHAPAMIRTEAYKTVNGYRDIEKTRGVEDYDLWFRMYAAGIRGCVLSEPLYSMFDGRGAAKRRTFARRLNEAWVRKEGYKLLKISCFKRIYVLKPVLLGMIPQSLYALIKKT